MDIDKVRALTDTEVMNQLVTERRNLYDLRFQLATRQLTDHNQLTQTRRSIARLLTVMTERDIDESKIPATPAPTRAPARRSTAAPRTTRAKTDSKTKTAAKTESKTAKAVTASAKGDKK